MISSQTCWPLDQRDLMISKYFWFSELVMYTPKYLNSITSPITLQSICNLQRIGYMFTDWTKPVHSYSNHIGVNFHHDSPEDQLRTWSKNVWKVPQSAMAYNPWNFLLNNMHNISSKEKRKNESEYMTTFGKRVASLPFTKRDQVPSLFLHEQ